jgi:hypothetical protein
LAERFCSQSRARIGSHFEGLWENQDKANYRFAQKVLNAEYAWLEKGVMPVEDFPV